MKFAGPLSPDIVFLQLEQQDNGKIKIVVHANKGAAKPLKKVGEIVPPPAQGQDLEQWIKPHITRIGMKLMMP